MLLGFGEEVLGGLGLVVLVGAEVLLGPPSDVELEGAVGAVAGEGVVLAVEGECSTGMLHKVYV